MSSPAPRFSVQGQLSASVRQALIDRTVGIGGDSEEDAEGPRIVLESKYFRVYHGLAISTSLLLADSGVLLPEALATINQIACPPQSPVRVFVFDSDRTDRRPSTNVLSQLKAEHTNIAYVQHVGTSPTSGWDVATVSAVFASAGLAPSSVLRIVTEDDPLLLFALGQDAHFDAERAELSAFIVQRGPTVLRDQCFGIVRQEPGGQPQVTWTNDPYEYASQHDMQSTWYPALTPQPEPGSRDSDQYVSSIWQTLRAVIAFHPAINLRETSDILADPPTSLYSVLPEIESKARNNLVEGRALVLNRAPRLKQRIDQMFDDQSGAISIPPLRWYRDVVARGLRDSQPSTSLRPWLRRYFQTRLPDFWQHDRPCMMRVLFTPTQVLLRGESYYVNMKNISPFTRLTEMLQELSTICTELQRADVMSDIPSVLEDQEDDMPWHLLLALLDQVRNISLQLLLFTHSGRTLLDDTFRTIRAETRESLLRELDALTTSRDAGGSVYDLARVSVGAYYDCFLGRSKGLLHSVSQLCTTASRLRPPLVELVRQYKAVGASATPYQRRELYQLVRRWREADHPGENLITACLAVKHARSLRDELDLKEVPVDAVGIGWGGIELPLVFCYLLESERLTKNWHRHVSVAIWSHYRNREGAVSWVDVPSSGDLRDYDGSGIAFLFDDNTLTGITLQQIRDELVCRGAREIRMFVGRYSGERRVFHMRMRGHGVYDPSFLLHYVNGYLGETHFSRSWSSEDKKYHDSIGIFSLARRRILECIHNNSSVGLYDREGF